MDVPCNEFVIITIGIFLICFSLILLAKSFNEFVNGFIKLKKFKISSEKNNSRKLKNKFN